MSMELFSLLMGHFLENIIPFNFECEVECIILALEQAVKYYSEPGRWSKRCYVLTGCESAINIFVIKTTF